MIQAELTEAPHKLPAILCTITPATATAGLYQFSEVCVFGLLKSSVWRRHTNNWNINQILNFIVGFQTDISNTVGGIYTGL
jgi:hypothetical protein